MAWKLTASEPELDGLVVRTAQLADILDVSTNHGQDLTRTAVFELLRKPKSAAVRGRYPLVAAVQSFSRYIRSEKVKKENKGSGAGPIEW